MWRKLRTEHPIRLTSSSRDYSLCDRNCVVSKKGWWLIVKYRPYLSYQVRRYLSTFPYDVACATLRHTMPHSHFLRLWTYVIPHKVICDSMRGVAQSHGKMSNNDTNIGPGTVLRCPAGEFSSEVARPTLPQGVKLNHSPPFNVYAKNTWISRSTPPYAFMEWCLNTSTFFPTELPTRFA